MPTVNKTSHLDGKEQSATPHPKRPIKHTGERESSAQQSKSRSTATSSTARPNMGPSSINRVEFKSESPSNASYARTTSKDHQHQGATEDTSARGSASHQLSARSQDTRAPLGRHSEDEHQNRTSESQGSGYAQWISNYLIPGGPPLRDTYQIHQSPPYTSNARTTSKDHQHPQGATEDTSARGSAPHQLSARSQDTRAPLGRHSEDEHQNRTSESQGSGYTQWVSNYLAGGPPLRDTYQNQYYRIRDELKQTQDELKQTQDELKKNRVVLGNHVRELRRKDGELRQHQQTLIFSHNKP